MIGLMVVDDEEGVRRSLRKVLEKDGYSILLAENGEQAIRIVRDDGPEIETVISDYRMPGIDGLVTLTEIGRINPEITRIMLTGYATMESAIEAVNAGIDGFLTKPFENAELRAKIKEYNIKKRLKQFVSEQVFRELQKAGKHIVPRKQDVTVLFTDIRGFAKIAEQVSPAELAELLNTRYFSPLDDIIFHHNGTLDKHMGDSIMGVFGAPISAEGDAERAVMSAVAMRDEIAKANESLPDSAPRIHIGVGISTGEVMAGVFGSSRKKEYTVFGPPVNLAARLERLAGGNQILICGETYSRVRHLVHAEKMDRCTIKGIERNLDIYRVTGTK